MKQTETTDLSKKIRELILQREQRYYEKDLNDKYDAYFDAKDWDNALLQTILMENYVIPKYGKESGEYATTLYKKGMLFKTATCVDDKIEALGLLIESKKLYEQLGLKYSECWKCCTKGINELIGN